jgi:hypothetical protein
MCSIVHQRRIFCAALTRNFPCPGKARLRHIEAQAQAAAVHLHDRPTGAAGSNYEVKFRAPAGSIFDPAAEGWKGALKEVKPVA